MTDRNTAELPDDALDAATGGGGPLNVAFVTPTFADGGDEAGLAGNLSAGGESPEEREKKRQHLAALASRAKRLGGA